MKKYLFLLLLLTGLARAQTSTVRSVTSLPGTCNSGTGPGGPGADHVDLWNGATNTPKYCSAPNVWSGFAGNVNSVFGRTGSVVAVAGDYTSPQISFNGNPWLDALFAGAVCDDSTDDTAAINAAFTTLYNQGGGTLVIPPGKTCKVTGQLTIPNNGGSSPLQLQPPIRITGWGGPSKTWGNNFFAIKGALDLQFNSSTAKLVTYGLGSLEIDHLNLIDNNSDCAAFVYTTLTTVNIHDNYIRGTAASSSACNDAIVLGGTDTTTNNSTTSGFNGYGSVIDKNFLTQIRRMVFAQNFVNGVQIVNNTENSDCGGTNHAAIEFNASASATDTGNYIAGNLLEIPNYKYGIWMVANAQSNLMEGNNLFDAGGTSTAGYRFEVASAAANFVIETTNASPTPFSDVPGTNYYLTSKQASTSIWPGQIQLTNAGTPLQSSANSAANYDIVNPATSDEFYQNISSAGSQPHFQWKRKPNGATAEVWFDEQRGSNFDIFTFGSPSSTNGLTIQGPSASGVTLRSQGSGTTAIICANGNCHVFANDQGQWVSNLAIGTPPFLITSHTPVPTLSLSGVANTSRRSETGVDNNVLTFSPPATAGSYRIRFVMSVSAANAATLGWTATWTDSNGNAQTPTNLALFQSGTAAPALTFTTSSAGNYYADANIDIDTSAANIVVKLTFTGTSFAAKVSANIERLQ